MKQLALYTVKPFLSQVEGVSEVRIIGGKQKEYWLTLDPQKMSTLGITPDIVTMHLTKQILLNRMDIFPIIVFYISRLQMLLFIRLMNWKIL